MAFQSVRLEMITSGPSPRSRGLDRRHVDVLAQLDGAVLPPILLRRNTLQIVDGRHRYEAARQRGDTHIAVAFFDGTAEEAFAVAVRRNIEHGLPLTLDERKAAATRILTSLLDRSDRWVASVTGLSPTTVGVLRHQCSTVHSGQLDRRVGADGRSRPVNALEGRRRVQELILESPESSLRTIARQAGVSPSTVREVRLRLASDGALGSDEIPPPPRVPVDPPMAESLDALLAQMRRDPSLRFNDSGRELLHWISRNTADIGRLRALVEQCPPHTTLLLVEFARVCQASWRSLAEDLENRGQTPNSCPER